MAARTLSPNQPIRPAYPPANQTPDRDQSAPDLPTESIAELNARSAPKDPADAADVADAQEREREDREAEDDVADDQANDDPNRDADEAAAARGDQSAQSRLAGRTAPPQMTPDTRDGNTGQAPQPVDGDTEIDPDDIDAREQALKDREKELDDRERAMDERDQKNTKVHVSRLDQKHIDQLPVAEYYSSGIDAYGQQDNIDDHARRSLSRLTICVLVTRNGYPVVGTALSENPEDYDATMGRKLSKQDAMHQLWALERYAVQGKLAGI